VRALLAGVVVPAALGIPGCGPEPTEPEPPEPVGIGEVLRADPFVLPPEEPLFEVPVPGGVVRVIVSDPTDTVPSGATSAGAPLVPVVEGAVARTFWWNYDRDLAQPGYRDPWSVTLRVDHVPILLTWTDRSGADITDRRGHVVVVPEDADLEFVIDEDEHTYVADVPKVPGG
jgi:hypothetical protein